MFNCGPVFHANYTSTADVVINQGGTDSGKTYAILQVLSCIAAYTRPPAVDPIISVVNKSVPDSKKGAYRVFQGIFNGNAHVQNAVEEWDKGERVVTFRSGWKIEFIGAIDEQTAKQGKRQYLFVNEANGIPWLVFWQYAKRTRIRVFIDYNPSEPFWAHDKLIGTTKNANDLNAVVQLIISDHRHNPFLSPRDHEKTENIRDPELHRVYARGKTGKLVGLIFPNWRMITTAEFAAIDKKGFGVLDFGYTNDPTASDWIKVVRAPSITKKHVVPGRAYVRELCYEPGLSMSALKEIYRGCGFTSETPIYCDHDFEAARQLRKEGIMATMVRKGPNSVKAGILYLQKEWEIFYTDDSVNIQDELRRYMWDKDQMTGKLLNEPIDQFNHHMDAIRSGLYTRYLKGGAG